MSRKESLTIGVALVSSALAIILHMKCLAWVVLVIGIGFIAYPFWMDYFYGKFRPSAEEILRMSADEYGRRLSDRKFERWVNHVRPRSQVVKSP